MTTQRGAEDDKNPWGLCRPRVVQLPLLQDKPRLIRYCEKHEQVLFEYERASLRRHELKLPISLETLRCVEWTAFVDSKLERKPVPYSSPHNRYEATRTGLPSPGNEVARLPKGDIGRKRWGCREGGPTKVRPRAELVCRKRRFPANALLRDIDIDHLELLLRSNGILVHQTSQPFAKPVAKKPEASRILIWKRLVPTRPGALKHSISKENRREPRPRGSSCPGEKIRYRVTASSNQVPLPRSRRISYKYTCTQVDADGEVIGEKKECIGIALRGERGERGERGDVPYTRLGRSAEAHRNPGSGTLETPVSLISAPRHPDREGWRRRAPGTVLSPGTSVHRVGSPDASGSPPAKSYSSPPSLVAVVPANHHPRFDRRNARYSAKKNSLVGGGTNGDDRDSKASRGSGERGSPGHSNGVSSPLHGRTVRFLCSVKATREIITREQRRAASYRKWPLLDPPRSTWEGPPPPSHHLHLRETETTEDERVAFYVSKSDEESRGPTK
ncbi:hypothetical protein G5I_02571 [Acromyrmex echinatior]|uniref:Uncharacterized protein n=1 Tax=Acromyrmex echinatior TaxID=103372 RepID=F4WAN3_ACREC|nr:hypothetical protein G5I_02571 [Acromyrmex echinatior]